MRYSNRMDHLEALMQKIQRLRAEISEINLNIERHRLERGNGKDAQAAFLERHGRLQEIQKELLQLSKLGNKTVSIEKRIEQHLSRKPLKRAA
jgi:hypothetical protein